MTRHLLIVLFALAFVSANAEILDTQDPITLATPGLGMAINAVASIPCPVTFRFSGRGTDAGKQLRVFSFKNAPVRIPTPPNPPVSSAAAVSTSGIDDPVVSEQILTLKKVGEFSEIEFTSRALTSNDNGEHTVVARLLPENEKPEQVLLLLVVSADKQCSPEEQAGVDFLTPMSVTDGTAAFAITMNANAAITGWTLNGVPMPDKFVRVDKRRTQQARYQVSFPAGILQPKNDISITVLLPGDTVATVSTKMEVQQ